MKATSKTTACALLLLSLGVIGIVACFGLPLIGYDDYSPVALIVSIAGLVGCAAIMIKCEEADNSKGRKVIFLDFDGVLTSEAYTRLCLFEYRQENLFGLDWFDPKCIDALRSIIDKTGADIVVSSSWRYLGLDKLAEVWRKNNMPGELVGTTPIDVDSAKESIRQWLSDNPCEMFVVLDDMPLTIDHLVKTNPRNGLSTSNALMAIDLLS